VAQTLGGYAAVGAAYFLISALVIVFRRPAREAREAHGKGEASTRFGGVPPARQ
jgi:hypothetical protein